MSLAYGSMAALYDRLMADMPYDEWQRLFERVWRERGGGPKAGRIVDLGCGTGSMAIRLANQGHQVAGVDLSGEMLSVAAAKRPSGQREEGGGGTVRWLEQDMREWALPEPADAVLSFCDCFNYLLEYEDIRSAIRATWEGLRPGGFFLFDMLTERQYAEYMRRQPFVLNEDDLSYIWLCDWDDAEGFMQHDLSIFAAETLVGSAGGRPAPDRFVRIDESHVQRAYPTDWILAELKAAGFTEAAAFGGFDRRALSERTKRAFYLAIK